jgi:hypothetical protein
MRGKHMRIILFLLMLFLALTTSAMANAATTPHYEDTEIAMISGSDYEKISQIMKKSFEVFGNLKKIYENTPSTANEKRDPKIFGNIEDYNVHITYSLYLLDRELDILKNIPSYEITFVPKDTPTKEQIEKASNARSFLDGYSEKEIQEMLKTCNESTLKPLCRILSGRITIGGLREIASKYKTIYIKMTKSDMNVIGTYIASK